MISGASDSKVVAVSSSWLLSIGGSCDAVPSFSDVLSSNSQLTAFRTDFPVRGEAYTLGDPTYWTLASAENFAKIHEKEQPPRQVPTRRRGKSGTFLLGGMHMTHYGYLPYHLIKEGAATEGLGGMDKLRQMASDLIRASKEHKLKEFNANMSRIHSNNVLRRIHKLSLLSPSDVKGIVYLPWFYDCNRNRYPRWEGEWDSRLGDEH